MPGQDVIVVGFSAGIPALRPVYRQRVEPVRIHIARPDRDTWSAAATGAERT